jgi:hypothetical protein
MTTWRLRRGKISAQKHLLLVYLDDRPQVVAELSLYHKKNWKGKCDRNVSKKLIDDQASQKNGVAEEEVVEEEGGGQHPSSSMQHYRGWYCRR